MDVEAGAAMQSTRYRDGRTDADGQGIDPSAVRTDHDDGDARARAACVEEVAVVQALTGSQAEVPTRELGSGSVEVGSGSVRGALPRPLSSSQSSASGRAAVARAVITIQRAYRAWARRKQQRYVRCMRTHTAASLRPSWCHGSKCDHV